MSENKNLDSVISKGSCLSNLSGYAVRLVAVTIIINLFVICVSAYLLTNSREQTVKQAEVTVQNLSKVLEADIDNNFDKTDIVLRAVVDEATKQIKNGGINFQAMNEFMANNNERLEEFQELRLTDSHGTVLYGTEIPAGLKVTIRDRDYFTILRDNPRTGLYISKPLIGNILKKWQICLARRVNNPDGSFNGVVYGVIPIEHFTRLFSKLNLKKGIVTLADENYEVIARVPEPAGFGSAIGRKITSPQLYQLVQAGHDSGVYTSISPVDGQERTIYYRKFDEYPLSIFVGLAPQDYLSEWRRTAVSITVLMVIFALCSIVLCWEAFVRKKQEVLAENELRKSKEELEERVLERTADLLSANEHLQHEIIERKRSELELKKAQEKTEVINQELKTANQQLAHFSENLAHELRTPIHSLMIESDLALCKVRSVEEYQHIISSNMEAYERLKNLIESLLFLARADNKKLCIITEKIDICQVLENIVDYYSEIISSKDIACSIDCQAVLFADPALLNRAMANLFENAIKYTPRNGSIILSAHQQDDAFIEITVKDTGCGIEPELLPKILDRYFWIENTHLEECQGTGLGLDIVKSIMAMHGGSIAIQSEPGNGTAVTLRFPPDQSDEDIFTA
jgi:signal transduction histidine kinase